MEILPNDVKRVIALKLPVTDLKKFCLTNKNINNVVFESKDFWRQKLIKDYPRIFDYFVRNKMIIGNPKNLYMRKYTEGFSLVNNFLEKYDLKNVNKEEIAKTIYSIYNDYSKIFPNGIDDDAKISYNNIILYISHNLRYRFRNSNEFLQDLRILTAKLINKDHMYITKACCV